MSYCVDRRRGTCSHCDYHTELDCKGQLLKDARREIEQWSRKTAELEEQLARLHEALKTLRQPIVVHAEGIRTKVKEQAIPYVKGSLIARSAWLCECGQEVDKHANYCQACGGLLQWPKRKDESIDGKV